MSLGSYSEQRNRLRTAYFGCQFPRVVPSAWLLAGYRQGRRNPVSKVEVPLQVACSSRCPLSQTGRDAPWTLPTGPDTQLLGLRTAGA